jgi:hypothetical protein
MARIKPKEQRLTNPNGANQYMLDPRQNLCWGYFVDPKSETFSNALASARKAGYPDGYARQITTQGWFLEKLRQLNMLSKAERNLDEMLDLPSKTHAMGAFGPLYAKEKVKEGTFKNGKVKYKTVKKPIMVHNPSLLKIKQTTSHFVAERVGRSRYGQQTPDPGNVYNVIIFANEQRTRIAKRIVRGGPIGSESSEG